MNNSPGEFNYHRTILLSLRRLNNATLNFPGRVSPDDVFGTNDIRSYMHEIVKIDPESLNITIRQFIQFINEVLTTEKIDISQLREIFTERLIRTFTNLPGCSDDDDEWLNKNSETFPPSPLTFSSPKSKDLLLTSRPKVEPEIENPWVTKYNTSTEMPKEYKNYIGGITFLGIYEITRILKPFGPIEPTNKFWTQIICGSAIHEVLYEECKEYFEERSNSNSYSEMSKLINRNLSRVWTLSSKEFPRVGPRTHVIFSGDVVLKDRRLVLTLLPPKIGTSRRYYRMFSSERFLQLKISTDIHSLDNRQKTKLKRLLLHPLPLAGRTYEFLYAKSDTLYYFATRGLDITKDISIKDVIDYNLPIELNKNDTTAKFYSRISLGFSNSTPTVIFKPNEILYDEADIKNDTYCFTDGCSEISLGAMKEVAEILGYEETPSVIQGRIGGAKGTWYIEPTMEVSGRKWIKLRRSQTKYHVIDKDHLCTLEVLHVSVPPKSPATLNSQFIRILIEGGVPVGIFLDMVKNHIENLKSQVVDCDDPHSLITWVTNISNVMIKRIETYNNDSYDDIIGKGDAISGFPNNPSEQCVQMLQAGFTPSTCPYLAKKLKCVLSSALKSLHNKFRIEVPLSRTLLCIADPTETLESGEIFIQLDKEAGRDERTGLPFGIIENEVIIARNPATLPSDIMRVKAVKNVHLSMYYNVVVFPVKGEVPLASYLSGGDYDGDKIFCCWEPTIVDNFKNAEILPTHPGVENAFIQNKQTVNELLSSTIPDKVETKLQELILDFYFKDLEPTLGLYDRWHRLQSSKFGLSDELSIYLAQMCAKLVDATKQGLTIKPNVFQRDNDLFNGLPVPYWMDKDNKSRNRESHLGVMDLLHKSIESEMKKINNKDFLIAKFTKDPDPHIKEFWCNEYTRAEQMNGEERLAYREDLNLIYRSSLDIIAQYNENYYKIFNDDREQRDFPFSQIAKSTGSTSYLNDKFKGVDYEFIIKFLNTPSVGKYKSNIFKYLKYRGPLALDNLDPLTMFELQLKAAALHLASIERKPTGQGCWIISFRLLCNIKSQMIDRFVVGGPRSIIDEVWQSMKIDKKWVKRYES